MLGHDVQTGYRSLPIAWLPNRTELLVAYLGEVEVAQILEKLLASSKKLIDLRPSHSDRALASEPRQACKTCPCA